MPHEALGQVVRLTNQRVRIFGQGHFCWLPKTTRVAVVKRGPRRARRSRGPNIPGYPVATTRSLISCELERVRRTRTVARPGPRNSRARTRTAHGAYGRVSSGELSAEYLPCTAGCKVSTPTTLNNQQ